MSELASSIAASTAGTLAEGRPLTVKLVSSAASQRVGHRLGRPYLGFSVTRTNPEGRAKYLYSTNAPDRRRFIAFASTTAATTTYFVVVY